ncbi:MAG: RdgB/HAM1 family non-canonical purine NTP pyrophosphatase, partial [Candidatus Bathyarchaeia archaeon]
GDEGLSVVGGEGGNSKNWRFDPLDRKRLGSVFFATGNLDKFREASLVLSEYGIGVSRVALERLEVQAESVEEIATVSVAHAVRVSSLPVFVEDAGLFVKALKGFPGPYSSYVYRTIGCGGVLRLLEGVLDRGAEFRSAAAYGEPGVEPVCFSGVASGRISDRERGVHGFGFDPIFEPDGGGGRTFAEMVVEEKNLYSHRARSMRNFADWYLERAKPGRG